MSCGRTEVMLRNVAHREELASGHRGVAVAEVEHARAGEEQALLLRVRRHQRMHAEPLDVARVVEVDDLDEHREVAGGARLEVDADARV